MPLVYTDMKSDVEEIEKSCNGLEVSNRVISDILFIYVDLESLKEKCDRRDLDPGFWLGRPKSYQARLQSQILIMFPEIFSKSL